MRVPNLAAPGSPLLGQIRSVIFVCGALSYHLLYVLIHRVLQLGVWNDSVVQCSTTVFEIQLGCALLVDGFVFFQMKYFK